MAMNGTSTWASELCSLPSADRPLRLAEFDRLFAKSVRRSVRRTPTRLDLVMAPAAEATARDLAAREAQCCSFFDFEFVSSGEDLLMQIGVPRTYTDILDALHERVKAVAMRELR